MGWKEERVGERENRVRGLQYTKIFCLFLDCQHTRNCVYVCVHTRACTENSFFFFFNSGKEASILMHSLKAEIMTHLHLIPSVETEERC